MATSINFNWAIAQKCTKGKVYDFDFETLSEDVYNCTFVYDGTNVRINDGVRERSVNVFRRDMRVKDAIALCVRCGGYATSGEVYKSPILSEMSNDYDNSELYTSIYNPSHDFEPNLPCNEEPYYLGFELETRARNEECYNALTQLVSNIWHKVSDSSIGGYGIEFVSTLLSPKDAVKASFFERFCDTLTGLAMSKTIDSCGLHCHISRSAFGEDEDTQNDNISKLVYLENFVLDSQNLALVFGRGTNEWAKVNEDRTRVIEHINALKPYAPNIMQSEGIKDAISASLLRGNKIRSGHNYPSERYFRVNITNKNTIEFRQGKGNINSNALALIAQHIVSVVNYVCCTPWHKLSAQGYYKSIPSTHKYNLVKNAFKPINE